MFIGIGLPITRPAQGRAFAPTDLSGLLAWYDARDAQTITQSAGAVSAWADKSYGHFDQAQATGAAKPTYSATSMGGQPGLTFDGGDHLQNSALSITAGTPIQAFAVMQISTAKVFERIISTAQGGGNDYDAGGYIPLIRNNNGATFGGFSGAIAGETPVTANTTTMLLETIVTGTTNDGYRDGNLGTSVAFTYPPAYAPDKLRIGAPVQSPSDTGDWMNGIIGEIVLIKGLITVLQRQQVEGYLANRWGLASSLPSGHPYKTTAP